MNKIFAGFIFLFLNFNIHFGQGTLALIPDFVGTLLLYLGAKEMAGESPYFVKVQPYFLGLTIYDVVVWLMKLWGRGGTVVAVLLSLAAVIVSLYASYLLFKGLEETESRYQTNLNAGQCLAMWKINAVLTLCCTALAWLPIVNIMLAIAAFVVAILLLVEVNKARSLYNALPRGTAM